MAAIKYFALLLVALFAVTSAAPGWYGHHKEHVVIHVPYKVHTVHHHHVQKVHVPVPVVKKVYVHEAHHDVHEHHDPWW